MAIKEKIEEILDGDNLDEMIDDAKETLNGGEKMTKKNINWKLYAKCVAGVVLVGAVTTSTYIESLI